MCQPSGPLHSMTASLPEITCCIGSVFLLHTPSGSVLSIPLLPTAARLPLEMC